jgi:RNA binding exosome subunit
MRKRDGYCVIYTKGNATYDASADEYESILKQFASPSTFIEFTGFFGDRVTILRAQVEGVALETADVIAARLADAKEAEREDALR